MSQLRARQFVGADSLRLVAQPSLLLMIGDIGCLGDIAITVEKYLAIVTPRAIPEDVIEGGDHDVMVQTIEYAYHAAVRDHGMILRYDNNHPWPGHADDHHMHRGDWRRASNTGRVEWIGADRWPTLGEVISEVMDWYHANRDDLPQPDRYAAPLSREPRTRWNPLA